MKLLVKDKNVNGFANSFGVSKIYMIKTLTCESELKELGTV